MTYALRVITPPPYEAISLAETKSHLKIDDDIVNYDSDIAGYIAAARGWLEGYTGLSLIQQTFEMSIDAWPSCGYLELPRSPLISVDSIKYIDSNGAEQTWGAVNYQTDLVSVPGRIALAYAGNYPSSFRSDLNAWKVRFTAGHAVGSPTNEDAYRESVPELAKLAMKIYVTGAYEGTLEQMQKAAALVAASLRTSIL